jgi:hypothetical protein
MCLVSSLLELVGSNNFGPVLVLMDCFRFDELYRYVRIIYRILLSDIVFEGERLIDIIIYFI